MADRNSIIEKIKALLAKTTENGCTEEEELAALAKARAWIDAHEITDGELQLSREERRSFTMRAKRTLGIPIRLSGGSAMPLNATVMCGFIVAAGRLD